MLQDVPPPAMLLFLASALAASLVVLPVDARGVPAESGEQATEALRDALTADGRFDIPRATALATAFAAGHETELRKAREALSSARTAIGKGDLKGGVAILEEAVSLHLVAGSATVRRGELADVLWLLADTRMRLGDTLTAREDLTGVAHLWPGYARTRARGSSGTAARMLTEIETGVAREPWKVDSDVVDAAFRATSPDWVVAGALDATGSLTLHLLGRDGEDLALAETVELPIDAAAPGWADVATDVADTASRGAAAVSTSAPRHGTVTIEPPEPAEPEVEEPVEDDPPALTAADLAPVARERAKPAREKDDRPVTIRQRGPADDPNRPITSRWWFWTALAGVVGGGTALGVVLAEPAPVVEVHPDPHYSVTVATD